MGKELYETSEAARDIFDRAGEEIRDMCFNGTDEQLAQTINTQPCLFTVTVAEYQAFLREESAEVSAVCGFSLGEYSACCAAGVFTFEEGLELVKKRAKLMDEAAKNAPGGMIAILGLDKSEIYDIIKGAGVSEGGVLEAVNFNCPGQTVVAGDFASLDKLKQYCVENGVKTVSLAVSGAFHSSLMAGVVPFLERELEKIDLKEPQIPIVSNVTARWYESGKTVELLSRQVAHAVNWEQSVRFLMEMGIEEFKEIGAGSVLMGFLRKIRDK